VSNVSTDVPFSANLSGLALSATYFYRAVAANTSGALVRGTTLSFSTVRAPTVATNPAVIGSAMTLSATVNPNGGATSLYFQYVTTNDGPPITQVTPTQNIAAGSSPVIITTVISGFQFTEYAVTAIAANAAGSTTGNTVTFVTGGSPILLQTTGSLNSCGSNQCAFMASTVNPEGMPTTAWFEVSSDTTFKTFTPTPAQSIVAGFASVPFNATAVVTNTQNVFIRAAASNAFGTVRTVSMRIFTP
jgi:hypothetical protein